MTDIIRLLPDSVANQIAAGEVIQRPASAVKEMLENSVDAGATDIRLILKDAGKSLIQVIDNGCGMSSSDARLCFERHATSKISSADDLFAIRTLGFRGEALTSIAAIAQIELKTRLHDQELGSCVIIEGSVVKEQTPCNCPAGTSISVKNLFFNVPARRNFLKSSAAELKHIVDEFFHVALCYKDVAFSFYHNGNHMYQLSPATLKKRIVDLMGGAFSERMVPLELDSPDVKISGFVGKPEFARKTRGEQYFFVNGRFIRHPYLHHSIENAFMELLPSDSFPSYFIYMDVDPKSIDINIHPTKTEINFLDSKTLYAVLRSTVRQALGKHHIIPSIDFETEPSLDFNPPPAGQAIKNPFNTERPTFNPFSSENKSSSSQRKINLENWERLYAIKPEPELSLPGANNRGLTIESTDAKTDKLAWEKVFQWHNKYIITNIVSGLVVIDQQRAHERILYEQYLERLKKHQKASQQELFPQNVTFSPSDSELLEDLVQEMEIIGFTMNKLSKNTFVITGFPVDWENRDAQESMDKLLEHYKQNLLELNLDKRINLARSMAINMAVKTGKKLQYEEMVSIMDQLFACQAPEVTPDGLRTYMILGVDEIDNRFEN